jgi:hypothetical protein
MFLAGTHSTFKYLSIAQNSFVVSGPALYLFQWRAREEFFYTIAEQARPVFVSLFVFGDMLPGRREGLSWYRFRKENQASNKTNNMAFPALLCKLLSYST